VNTQAAAAVTWPADTIRSRVGPPSAERASARAPLWRQSMRKWNGPDFVVRPFAARYVRGAATHRPPVAAPRRDHCAVTTSRGAVAAPASRDA
jgi:hypothetical protein